MKRMRAVLLKRYGTPDQLSIGETEVPTPGPTEVLVRVKAASLNALDKHLSNGVFLARIRTGFFRPKYGILGSDLAGDVVAVGEKVTCFKVGDRVFGGRTWGAFAEYACLDQEKAAIISEGVLSYAQAAALPVAAGTALQAMRAGHVQAGQKVLINGASGGVGTYCVQLAKLAGAHVTAVCSEANVALVKALGADAVVDYGKKPVSVLTEVYDVVIDNVGNLKLRDCKRLISTSGHAVVVGYSSTLTLLGLMIGGPLASRKKGKKIGMLDTEVNHEDLSYLVNLLAQKKITSVIDREYPMENIREAMEYLWTRRVKSKLILTMATNH